MTENRLAQEIFSRYGAVTRARGCFLYTKKGVRLTDLYQANGRAVLGWGGGDAFTRLKNLMNRGITGAFITEVDPQLDKAVSKLLVSDRKVLVYQSRAEAENAARCFSKDFRDWMPWNPESPRWSSEGVVLMEPPLPWTNSIFLVCVERTVFESVKEYPEDVKLPSPLTGGICRALYNLIAALQVREEKQWFIYDPVLTKFFTRKGPWLFPKVPAEKYDDFVLDCLDAGVVINPDPERPSLVPFGADKGNFSALKKLSEEGNYASV